MSTRGAGAAEGRIREGRSSVWSRLWFSHSVMPHSVQPHGLQPARLLCPWDSPDKNTGVCCPFLLQGIFLTQVSCTGRWTLY